MRQRLAWTGILILGFMWAHPDPAVARELTFDERVAAQESIERVYYSHQTGATTPFGQAIPRSALEQKVRAYLKESVALEVLWHTPITGDMLRREIERIERDTRLPDRLEEIFAALGHDRFLLEECLGRSILADRLTRSFFETDRGVSTTEGASRQSWEQWLSANHPELDETRILAVSDAAGSFVPSIRPSPPRCFKADTWNDGVLDDTPMPRVGFTATWTGSLLLVWGGWSGDANSPIFLNTGSRYDPATDTWKDMSALNVPDGRAGHSAVWTGKELIVWGGFNDSHVNPAYLRTGGRYDPSTDTWKSVSMVGAPSVRAGHTAVWTGKWMIVWGGLTRLPGFFLDEYLSSGARYDPMTNAWTATSMTGGPVGRTGHAAVWTGREMIVWGGFRNEDPILPEIGGRYDPVTNRWTPTSTLNAPPPRDAFAYVWSGSEMIIWGGFGHDGFYNSGGRYDPAADSWTPTSTLGDLPATTSPTAVWANDEMIVWGGELPDGTFTSEGAVYSPTTDSWRPVSSINSPAPRFQHGAVWTGDLMLVWGGWVGSIQRTDFQNTGGRYDPASDSWTPTSTSGAPEARTSHTAVWTGSTMIVWGGQNLDTALNTGGRYDPTTDSWSATSIENAPVPRYFHTAIWDGAEMIVWGGFCGSASCGWFRGDGSRYDPNLDKWTPIADSGLAPRRHHRAVWTGSEMIIIGGQDFLYSIGDGGRYDPAHDSWTRIPPNSFAARYGHTAVWTGEDLLIWGGISSGFFVSGGGRYDPRTGGWSALSQVNQPPPRTDPSVVWTGQEMIVWGGISPGSPDPTTGGRYDPATDTWSPTSSAGAPGGRGGDPAVWTGREMIVWGRSQACSTQYICGFDNEGGARYDPVNDTWSTITALNAPDARFGHTAVWTGSLMIVWGGDTGRFPVNTGGSYVPNTVRQPPVVDAGADLAAECSGPDGTHVSLSGAAATCGNADALAYTWTGPFSEQGGTIQGASAIVTLPGGQHTLTLSVTDETGLTSSDTLTVRIVDSSPPGLTCPQVDPIECAGPGGTPSQLPAVAVADSCDPRPMVSNSFSAGGADASGVYPLGSTVVSFAAVDASGNTARCEMVVGVRDTLPPSLSIAASPAILWPPNHRLVPTSVAWQARDVCDPSPAVVLMSATSSEPDDAPGNGDGNTMADIQDASVGSADSTLSLRAERSSEGSGRTYSLTYAARDASGNTASALGIVSVPHDLGTGPEPLTLNLESTGTPGMAHIFWNAVSGAESYELLQGSLEQVASRNGVLWLGSARVLASGVTETGHVETSPGRIPEIGKAFFYLVQYRAAGEASGWGTESGPWPAEAGSCELACSEASGASGVSQESRRR